MTEFEMEELMPLLKELTDRYTGKESTSVTYEKARQLMEAILYCMETDRMEFGEVNEREAGEEAEGRVAVAEKEDVKAVWRSGYNKVVRKTKQARQMYDHLIQTFDDYGNRALHDTVTGGISGFFLYYDAMFQPQNHIITMDYPVLTDLSGICGIHAVYRYLQCIIWEQQFLSAFPRQHVLEVLSTYHNDYQNLFINLASVVLQDSLIYGLEGGRQQADRADDRRTQLEAAGAFLREHGEEALESRFLDLFARLTHLRFKEEDGLQAYLKQDIHPFAVEIGAIFS